jgi:hypothetical protein
MFEMRVKIDVGAAEHIFRALHFLFKPWRFCGSLGAFSSYLNNSLRY